MELSGHGVLADRYDVIVIGSGLAGLTAAALIARRGLATLLVEHHYLPGGMCTTLRRQDFSFDTGTALMYGFGERGFNPHRFVMNELGADIDVIEHEALLRMRFPGGTITFWPDYDRFIDEVVRVFPKQERQLRALYGWLYRRYTDVIARQQMVVPPDEMPPAENLRTLLRHPVQMLQTLRMLRTSTRSVLERFIDDPELMRFFDKLTSTYCYCTVDETPAILAATMFVDNHVGGAFYPARSPQVLTSTLEKAFEDAGGQALYGRRVDEIVIEGGAARGVRLADGTELRCDQVVADVTVWNLYERLIRPEHVRAGRREWARNLAPTYPSIVLYIGVDAAAIPPGTMPVEMLIDDMDGVNAGDLTLYISSLDDPSICPPGTHAVTTISPATEPWPGPDDPGYRSDDYRRRKEQATERVLDQVERAFPGFRSHIQVLESATPSTIERYTLKNGGAVGGPKQSIGQEILRRLHTRSEWKNLVLCGDSTVMGMGTPAVTVSGIGAANRVLERAGLPGYRRRRFDRQAVRVVEGAALGPLPAPGADLSARSAARLARECQYCERPGCTRVCPAGIDLRNVMRRIEAGNIGGAARVLRDANPLAEVCGWLCRPELPCERACNRRSFSDHPVRIARLEAWVSREAGLAGWPAVPRGRNSGRAAVIGAGPAGMSCAFVLARLGWRVRLLDAASEPGGGLLGVDEARLPGEAARRDIYGVLGFVEFGGGHRLGRDIGLDELARDFGAVFLAGGPAMRPAAGLEARPGPGVVEVPGRPGFLAGGALVRDRCSTVQAAADGVRAAALLHARAARES